VESSARRGLTFRSWKSANCFRRKRFSAARALRECAVRKTSRTKSTTTADNVRKQCATARKTNEPDMNAQDRTLQNVKSSDWGSDEGFCGPHLQREFQLALSHPRHVTPSRTLALGSPARADSSSLIDSLTAAQHVLEMYRRSVADHSARHLLARLARRLAKILTETMALNLPQK